MDEPKTELTREEFEGIFGPVTDELWLWVVTHNNEKEMETSEMPETPVYDDMEDAMKAPFVPNTPCRVMATRPCIIVDLHNNRTQGWRVHPCPPGNCARFPIKDNS